MLMCFCNSNYKKELTMPEITFSQELRVAMIDKLQHYFDSQLELELEQFDAEFLLDFISQEFAPKFYNQGLHDARAIVEARVALIDDDIYAIEK